MENRDNPAIKNEMLNDNEWIDMELFVATLSLFKKYSTKLQSEVTTLSDFYCYWVSLKIKLEGKTDPLSKNLLVEMNSRNDALMDNPALVAAVYLDPRFQRGLGQKKSLAIQVLSHLYNRIREDMSSQDADVHPQPNGFDDFNEEMHLQRYLDTCSGIQSGPANNTTQNIGEILAGFDNTIQPINSSIFEYWENQKTLKPELYKLASVIMSIPPTQCTVERAFSALGMVLTSRRTNLSDKILSQMLLIRFNFDLISSEFYETH